MSLYQIRARQGPHIKTYLISWQLFGPKISLEIHCWPITTFFKTVGENFSQCQIVLFCMMVSNCPILHDGVKLSQVSNCPRCQIVLFAFMVSNCPTCHYGVKLSEVSNGPRCQIVHGVKWSQDRDVFPQITLDQERKSRPVVIVLMASHSIFRPVKISLEFFCLNVSKKYLQTWRSFHIYHRRGRYCW